MLLKILCQGLQNQFEYLRFQLLIIVAKHSVLDVAVLLNMPLVFNCQEIWW